MIRIVFTSALHNDGLDELKEILKDKKSVICGPSCVGKSSLLNALAPDLSIKTGEIGYVTHKGRHTTTSVTLHPLPFGGWVADTPGVRQLGFWQITPEQTKAAFPDVQSFVDQCYYANCTHTKEQGCAVKKALQNGEIHERRLKSYLQMMG